MANGEEHHLVLTFHQAAYDVWSAGIVMRELAALYAPAGNDVSPLDEPEVQYADFAVWQRDPS